MRTHIEHAAVLKAGAHVAFLRETAVDKLGGKKDNKAVKMAKTSEEHSTHSHEGCCEGDEKQTQPSKSASRSADDSVDVLQRFPSVVYKLVAGDVICPNLLNPFIGGAVIDAPPVTDFKEFADLLDTLAPLRSCALQIVAKVCTRIEADMNINFRHIKLRTKNVVLYPFFNPFLHK